MLYLLFLYGPALATFLTDSEQARAWAWWLTLMGSLAWFCLRAAGSAATAVSRERELGTWEALCATRLTPGEIYWRKLSGVLRPLLLPYLVFLTLPLCYRGLGEVVVESWLPVAVLTLVYTCFSASLGLYASLRCASSPSAGRLTFGWVGLVAIAPLVAWFALLVVDSEPQIGLAGALCPTLAYMSTYLKNNYTFQSDADMWRLSALLYGGLAVALTGAGLRLVGQPVQVRGVRARAPRDLGRVEDPLAYRAACGEGALGWATFRVFLILTVYCGLTWAFAASKVYVLWCLLGVAAVSLRAIARGVGVVAGERERGTLEVLLASPLKPAEILRSKLRVALRPVAADVVVTGLLVVHAGWRAGQSGWVIGQNLVVLAACAAFFGAVAVHFSARQGTTLKAAQRAYLVLGFLSLVTFWVDVPLNQFLRHDFALLIWLNPLVAAVLPAEKGNIWMQDWLPLACSLVYVVAATVLVRRSAHHLQGA